MLCTYVCIYVQFFDTVTVLKSTPSLRDLTNLVTPDCAAEWRVVGSLLGLTKSNLDIIEHDHGRNAISCCSHMWGNWLETNASATWEDVLKVLEHKAVKVTKNSDLTDSHSEKGMLYTYIYIYVTWAGVICLICMHEPRHIRKITTAHVTYVM